MSVFPEILADPTIIVFIHVNKPPLKLPDIQPTVYEPSFWTENICLKRSKGEHCTLYSLFKFLASSEQQQSNQEHFSGTHVLCAQITWILVLRRSNILKCFYIFGVFGISFSLFDNLWCARFIGCLLSEWRLKRHGYQTVDWLLDDTRRRPE